MNFTLAAFSISRVSTSSVSFDCAPPILVSLPLAAAALRKSCVVWYGESCFTHSRNSSCAIAAIGVRSVCLKATFDTIGCCQVFEVPKTTLYGSPACDLP